MKYHPIANVWPMMTDEQIQELAEDIRSNGQLNPVWLYEGQILDGRNRWAACQIAGVEPQTKEYKGDEPTAFAVALNDRRRHCTKSVLAAVGLDLLPFFAADAKRRQKESGKINGRGQKVKQKVAEPKRQQSRDEAAAAVGVNRQYIQDAKKVKAADQATFEKVKNGKMSLQDAKREVAKKPTDDWRPDERARQKQVKAGETVVANQQNDKQLIAWAEASGKAVRIDRGSKYGNPFVMGQDGDRDAVCDSYANHYLPHKPSIAKSVGKLAGKVLVCHCYPERCHGNALLDLIKDQCDA
jgi:hypothetical protein